MLKAATVCLFLFTFIKDKVAPTLRLTLVCFQKVDLLYSREGAKAASKILPRARAA
jgi:hypothetical protein